MPTDVALSQTNKTNNNKHQLSVLFQWINCLHSYYTSQSLLPPCCARSNTSQERSPGSPTCPMTASLIAPLSLIYRFYRRPGSRAPGTPLPYPYNVHCLSKSWSEARTIMAVIPLAPFGSLPLGSFGNNHLKCFVVALLLWRQTHAVRATTKLSAKHSHS